MSVYLELTWGTHMLVVPLGVDSCERLPGVLLEGASACCIPGVLEGNPGYWTHGWPATSHS